MANNPGEHIQQLQHTWSQSANQPIQEGEEMIEVSSATRKIAGAYERFRNTLEPEEEDILRRNAIYRTLERRLWQDKTDEDVAIALVQELIRANYFQPVPRKYIGAVVQDISRARLVLQHLDTEHQEWFLSLVAVSIDQRLHTHDKQAMLARLMYHDTFKRGQWVDDLVDEADRATQLYIACYRVLFAADDYEITYTYFTSQFPAWGNPAATEADLINLAAALPAFRADAMRTTRHPARHRLMRILRPASVPYRILYDLLQKHGEALWANPADLEAAIRDAVGERRTAIRSRMRRRAWSSIMFLFFTKTILTGLVEYPYELFVLRQVHWMALGINIVFHPLLLVFTSLFAALPGQSNTDKIVEQVSRIVTGSGELPTIVFNPTRQYGPVGLSGFAIIYILLFLAIFWGLFWLLDILSFSLVAMFLFVVFLGLVVFLSFRIRRAIDDIRIEQGKEGFIGTLFSFIGLPILEFGRWLSRNIQNINVLLFVMDRILEAPFKLLIDVIEDWFSFVRDRKEEIV